MICYEVFRNGKPLSTAGVREGVLVANVTWLSGRSPKPWTCDLRVGGLADGTHLDWLLESLQVGDEILIKVQESEKVDPPKDLRPVDPVAARSTDLAMSRKYYAELAREMKILEAKWGNDLLQARGEDA